jgi:predicted cobalt transporter CbtA
MAKATTPQGAIKEIKKKGEEAAYSPLMDTLTRIGYAVKGFIYVAIGFIAISSALGESNTPADQLGAIAEFSKFPFAQLILWTVLVGLISYSLWGVIRAILDPFHKGKDFKGLMERGGYLISAITYATFVYPTYQLIIGARRGTGTNGTVEMASNIMSMPLGRWIVGAVGLAAIAAGLYQIYMGIKMDFDQRFKPYALSAEQLRIAKQVGRYGTIARGIVFGLAGYFLFLAAYQVKPGNARGFDAALDFLAKQSYGIWFLAVVAIGLIAFGIYSFMSAAWFRLKH